ncbi:MAG: DUF882 domain-containing protein [Desulfobacteraceae bacterium]|nr:DUF882 domain-containing protein [Desulfobacteraceae bacterium]
MNISRRSFLKQAAAGTFACMLPWPAWAGIGRREVSGILWVQNIHTGESLRIRYLDGRGNWVAGAREKLDRMFRCHYNGTVKPIEPSLYLLIDRIHTRLGAGRRPVRLISGYRSPEYNRLLRARGSGVAKNSYHLKAMAADIHISGINNRRLYQAARAIKAGGAGSYSEFVHVDVGPVRFW